MEAYTVAGPRDTAVKIQADKFEKVAEVVTKKFHKIEGIKKHHDPLRLRVGIPMPVAFTPINTGPGRIGEVLDELLETDGVVGAYSVAGLYVI